MSRRKARAQERDEELLALEVEELELVTELKAREVDLSEGLVPQGMVRALYPHEIDAKVNFAVMEAELDSAAGVIENRLIMDRDAFIDLLEDDLAQTESADALIKRLTAIDGPAGVLDVKGAKKLVTEATAYHRGVLTELAMASATRVRQEAVAQGVTVPKSPIRLDPETKSSVERHAVRLAQGPLVDAVRTLRERAFLEAAK